MKFSIVIPLYNKGKSVKKTIESVLDQIFTDFELIIVNDGSTDNSIDVVNTFTDPRITIINKENGGVSSARNVGIKKTKGDYVVFLDADDLWSEYHLIELDYLINKYQDKKVFSTSYTNNIECLNSYINQNENKDYIVDDYFESIISKSIICSITVAVKRECFSTVGYFNENLKRGEDIDMWCRLAKVYDVVKSNRITAVYRLDAEERNCVGISDLNSSVIFYYDLKKSNSKSEKKYYIITISRQLIVLLINFQIKSFVKLLFRYRQNCLQIVKQLGLILLSKCLNKR